MAVRCRPCERHGARERALEISPATTRLRYNQRDADRLDRRRPGRALFRDPHEPAAPVPRDRGRRAQPRRRHLRLRRRVLGRDARPLPGGGCPEPRGDHPGVRALGRHRHALRRPRPPLHRPRLLGHVAPDAADDPPGALRRAGRDAALLDGGRRPRALRERRPRAGRRRRQLLGAREARGLVRPARRLAAEPLRLAWHHGPVVLVGDAAHTAHFSIGSGTKLAMEDVIELARHVRRHRGVPEALAAYEAERRPLVEALQRAAQTSLEWFEGTERYHGRLEPVQFAYSLLTRSLRVTHENLRTRDPKLVAAVERWFAERAAAQTGCAVMAAPPMSTPFRLRDVVLDNRLVVERAGTPGAPGLVLLGSLDEPRGHGARVGLRLAGDFAAGARAATDARVDLLELDVADKPWATLQAFDAARAAWPMARPIAVRITAGGDADATIELARVLAARGCDLVSLATGHDPMAGLGAISLSDRIRHEAGIPTLVGAEVDTRPDINSVLAAGRADLCVIRPSRAPSLASAMQQPLWS